MEIILKNLTKKFGDVIAVNNLDLTIPSGKLISLLGPSGCGKSTTLFMLAGLHEVTGGKIYFGDKEVTNVSPEHRGIGLVFQNYALYPHMTVEQNIAFPLENQKVPKDERKKIVKEMAELVQISELLARKPGELSGGQQQRVAIARALAKKPEVLLLDEPLSNLDARLRLETREEIRRIQKETGITTIFVTHDQEEAMSISDEMIVMNDGLFQQQATPQEMYANPTNEFVGKFLGTPPLNLLKGKIKDGQVLVGEEKIMDLETENQEVTVGIRPEALKETRDEGINIFVDLVEHVGRDKMIIGQIDNQRVRIIVDAEVNVESGENIMLGLRKQGVHIFNKNGDKIL